ncbi:hypothetical protein ACQJBY_021697 [Aegilops geniculata]
MGSSSAGGTVLRGKFTKGKDTGPSESPLSVNSDSSNHDTLLIHSMEQDALAEAEKEHQGCTYEIPTQLVASPIGSEKRTKTCAEKVKENIQVTELEGPFGANDDYKVEYSVQSPDSALDCCGEVIPTPPLVSEYVLRFSLRTARTNLEKVEDRAKAVNKKRDLEVLEHGALLLRDNAMRMMRLCASAHTERSSE